MPYTVVLPDNDDDSYKVSELKWLFVLTLWVDQAGKALELRHLIYNYIRLFVFSYLELRHICCDINRIQHHENPDYTRQPYPRYSPKDTRRIRSEDTHLCARLEPLVSQFISQYDSFGGQLESFVVLVIIQTMREVAKELKEEDEALYASGRRDLGVVMLVDEDEVEQEDGDTEEEQADIEEESDDED